MLEQQRSRSRFAHHPSQVVVLGFAAAVALGTLLLMLPISTADGDAASPLTALFTATSAVCVTGLATVDTGTYWSGFGQAVILGLIQVGGFGIMTMASLLGLLVARRLGLRSRVTTATETKTIDLGDVRRVLVGVARITIVFELIVAVVLSLRFALGYGYSPGRAAHHGIFHSISAFNNAGFSLNSDSLEDFTTDPVVWLPIAIAVIAGGIGFPVLLELRKHLTPRLWSLHTKLTIGTTIVLLVLGTVFTAFSEWSNPGTLGQLDIAEKLEASFFHSAMTRTAGFNSLDVGSMREGTWLGTIALMFIGGGSAGTAGGIKVTTFSVLFFVVLAEVRGDRDSNAFRRRIEPGAQRQALTVVLLGIGAVVASTLALMEMTRFSMGAALFEVTSAFGTVGLSTGITAAIPAAGQLMLVLLMFLGRLGPITLVSALALRQREQLFRLPQDRPIIG